MNPQTNKTYAEREYLLSKNYLNNLTIARKKQHDEMNQQNESKKYFSKEDIIKHLKKKYNLENEEQVINKITEIRHTQVEKMTQHIINQPANKKMKASEKRKHNLIITLRKHGLALRSDSKLCEGYIDGSIKDYTLDEIADRMCEMKYLYEYCDFDSAYQKAYEDQQEEYNAGYYPDCTVFEQAEMSVLSDVGGYPTVFPWLKKSNPQ